MGTSAERSWVQSVLGPKCPYTTVQTTRVTVYFICAYVTQTRLLPRQATPQDRLHKLNRKKHADNRLDTARHASIKQVDGAVVEVHPRV